MRSVSANVQTRHPGTKGEAVLQSAAPSTGVPSLPPVERRRLGAYYTTEPLARVLVEWAVTDSADTVMDASYGGCAFLRQALDHLRGLGSTTGVRQVYGADVDGSTAPWRAKLVSQGVPDRSLHEGDFLLTTPGRELPRCRAAVGNPPYVRHHRLTSEQLKGYETLRTQTGLSARASAWAYFVLHSLSFLEPGGRLALLLPGAALHDGGYAAQVRAVLAARCERVMLVRVAERLFPEALEETVVLLATIGATTGDEADVERAQVRDVAALAALMRTWPSRPVTEHQLPPAATLDLVQRARGGLRTVADVADVRIGVVTGANTFFVRKARDWPADPAAAWVPVVSRGAWLDRIIWLDADTARCEGRAVRPGCSPLIAGPGHVTTAGRWRQPWAKRRSSLVMLRQSLATASSPSADHCVPSTVQLMIFGVWARYAGSSDVADLKCALCTWLEPAASSRNASTSTYSVGSLTLRDQSNHRQPSSARVASVKAREISGQASACSGLMGN